MPPSGCPPTFLSFSDMFLSVKNWCIEIALHIQLFALNLFCSLGFKVKYCIHSTFRLSAPIFVIFGQVFVGKRLTFWECLTYSAVCPKFLLFFGFQGKILYTCHLQAVQPHFFHFPGGFCWSKIYVLRLPYIFSSRYN